MLNEKKKIGKRKLCKPLLSKVDFPKFLDMRNENIVSFPFFIAILLLKKKFAYLFNRSGDTYLLVLTHIHVHKNCRDLFVGVRMLLRRKYLICKDRFLPALIQLWNQLRDTKRISKVWEKIQKCKIIC